MEVNNVLGSLSPDGQTAPQQAELQVAGARQFRQTSQGLCARGRCWGGCFCDLPVTHIRRVVRLHGCRVGGRFQGCLLSTHRAWIVVEWLGVDAVFRGLAVRTHHAGPWSLLAKDVAQGRSRDPAWQLSHKRQCAGVFVQRPACALSLLWQCAQVCSCMR
jgi:hypothetical protein